MTAIAGESATPRPAHSGPAHSGPAHSGPAHSGPAPSEGTATDRSASPDAAAVYALGSSAGESARLQRQSEELRPESVALLEQIGLKPGQSAIDLGCGPRGIIDLLSAAVGPGGRAVGLDADPAHVAMARQYSDQSGLANVEIMAADARHTGLPAASFDLVHARTLLVTIPEPAEVVAEMVRLGTAGGWVASPGGRRRVWLVLPADAGLGPALPALPQQLRPVRRRSLHRPPAGRAVPAGGGRAR